MKKTFRLAFTLLEVMIFVLILSIVLVTAASFVTRLLVNIRTNEHRTKASFMADFIKEWMNSEREGNSWSAFTAKGSVAGVTYCINNGVVLSHTIADLGTATFPAASCSGYSNILPGMEPIYRRELVLKNNFPANPTQVTATVTMSWLEIGRTESFTVESIYSSPF